MCVVLDVEYGNSHFGKVGNNDWCSLQFNTFTKIRSIFPVLFVLCHVGHGNGDCGVNLYCTITFSSTLVQHPKTHPHICRQGSSCRLRLDRWRGCLSRFYIVSMSRSVHRLLRTSVLFRRARLAWKGIRSRRIDISRCCIVCGCVEWTDNYSFNTFFTISSSFDISSIGPS